MDRDTRIALPEKKGLQGSIARQPAYTTSHSYHFFQAFHMCQPLTGVRSQLRFCNRSESWEEQILLNAEQVKNRGYILVADSFLRISQVLLDRFNGFQPVMHCHYLVLRLVETGNAQLECRYT